ncbi:MAG: DUF4442 domain-containing protein [Alphaproteobacteria bacterium]|nr:DUF4442 domain-containing protein [Alphaproteobacteria bacterium]
MKNFAMIKAHLSSNVPFANHTGVTLLDVNDGRAVAALEQSHETSNHIGTQHAGALFTLAEAASGAAMAGAFADRLLSIRPVAAAAQIRYLRIANGRVTAHARIDGDPEALRAALDATRRVQFPVHVSLRDDADKEVADMTVEWNVRVSRAV